ncbi:tyrosine-type recombinase/integrase [Desulforhopalus singaporensis]|uniref:Site-specific recombinase XerD n=1 Tax=Desulforhopalus singaporensis TaxID=91360 RepID=A0A1H0V9J9_9BACT|nr:site-specific integrase [Desulforhopalus singaporensis]SDP74878.1 Site-specific recombinase XerD [Desulforhopalus singaporensis]
MSVGIEEVWKNFAEIKLYNTKGKETEILRWEKHIYPYFRGKTIAEINNLEVSKFTRYLEEKTLSPQTRAHILGLLRRVILQSIKWEIYSGPPPHFEMPKFDNKSLRYLTIEEADLLFAELKKRSILWHDFSLLALNTACRSGELLKLDCGSVDTVNKCLYILDSKNSKTRVVPLNKVAFSVIKKYLTKNNENRVFTYKGKNIDSVSPTFRRCVSAVGLNENISDRRYRVTFHTLRHTAASWMIQEGVPLLVVCRLLGHCSLKTTMRYAHLDPTQRELAINVIEMATKKIFSSNY